MNISDCKVPFSGTIDPSRLPHAIIIEGNVEKGLCLAKYISSLALCTGEISPCEKCNACEKVLKEIHPDIFTHVASGSPRAFHIEVIRNIKEDAFVKPNEGRKKIYILGNAQSMTDQAQNALLKLLEEPPSYIVIIIVLPSASSLLTTVRSRSICLTLSDGEILPDEQAISVCKGMLTDILSKSELDFMRHFGAFEKDKELLRKSLTALFFLFRDALVQKYSGKAIISDMAETTRDLGLRLSEKQLQSLIQTVKNIQKRMSQNANHTLIITKLCADLRTSVNL